MTWLRSLLMRQSQSSMQQLEGPGKRPRRAACERSCPQASAKTMLPAAAQISLVPQRGARYERGEECDRDAEQQASSRLATAATKQQQVRFPTSDHPKSSSPEAKMSKKLGGAECHRAVGESDALSTLSWSLFSLNSKANTRTTSTSTSTAANSLKLLFTNHQAGEESTGARCLQSRRFAASATHNHGIKLVQTFNLLIVAITTIALLHQLAQPNQRVYAAMASSSNNNNPLEQQYFEQQPERELNVPLGADVRLRCLVRNRQGECAWLRNGKIVGNIARKYQYAKAPQDGDCSLQIKNSSVALDDGLWQCQVLSADIEQDALQTRDARLIVMVAAEKPQIKNLSPGSNKLIVEENKPKIVTCEMRGGNPAPQIEWFLDGKNVTKEASQTSSVQAGAPSYRLTQSKMRLADVKRSQNGKNLTCVGVHPTFNQATSVELDVQYLPSVSVVQREFSIVEGSPLSINCQVDANPAPSHVNWRLVSEGHSQRARNQPSEALVANKQGPVLEFLHISRDYNQNVFECLAQNALGVSTPADVKLNVLYTPFLLNTSTSSSVALGQEAKLFCLFDGNPAPEIRWFYTDPLSRTALALPVDMQQLQATAPIGGSKTHLVDSHLSSGSKQQQQELLIRNVTYRNEGDYHCEARNTINGEQYAIRSSNMALDVYGEPQFLAGAGRTPLPAKAVQGSRADIALTFCSDPQPYRVYWQFGSIRLEVRSNFISGPVNQAGGSTQAPPPPQVAATSAGNNKHAHASSGAAAAAAIAQRFQVQPLVALQKRDSSFSKVPSCFEAQLTLLEPELSDQRDYNLFVYNERSMASGTVRLRVSSPLSPALMITSAFVFICALFLLSLLFLFVFKKRQRFLAAPTGSGRAAARGSRRTATNGTTGANSPTVASNGVQQNGKKPLEGAVLNGGKNGLVNGNGNLLQTATANGQVQGAGSGQANGASNPNGGHLEHMGALKSATQSAASTSSTNFHGLMSMASSDTSCTTNDQRQLLANCSASASSSASNSDRNSSASSSAASTCTGSNAILGHHTQAQSDFGARHHQVHPAGDGNRSTANSTPLNHISVDDELQLNGSYQATESVTHGAQLSPPATTMNGHHHHNGGALIYANIGDYSTANSPILTSTAPQINTQADFASGGSPLARSQDNSMTLAAEQKQQQQQQQKRPPSHNSPIANGSSPTSGAGDLAGNNHPQQQQPSVGATIAMMNSLAAAAAASSPTQSLQGAPTGALSQQLAGRSTRRPGPPKPPKPSIQQRSRFYQQQAAAAAAATGGGLVMIGSSQMAFGQEPSDDNNQAQLSNGFSANELAVEYSRLAFPARAEL